MEIKKLSVHISNADEDIFRLFKIPLLKKTNAWWLSSNDEDFFLFFFFESLTVRDESVYDGQQLEIFYSFFLRLYTDNVVSSLPL